MQDTHTTQTESTPDHLILQPFSSYLEDAWNKEYEHQETTYKCGESSLKQVSNNTLGSIDRIFNFFPFPAGMGQLAAQLKSILDTITLQSVSLVDVIKDKVPAYYKDALNNAFMETILLHGIITLCDPFTGEFKNEVREALRKKYPNYDSWETTHGRKLLEMTILHSYILNVIGFNLPLYLDQKNGITLDVEKAMLFQKSITTLFGDDHIKKLQTSVAVWRQNNINQALTSLKALSKKAKEEKLLSEETFLKLKNFTEMVSSVIDGKNTSDFISKYGIDILISLEKVLKKQAEIYAALFDPQKEIPLNLDFSQQLKDIANEKLAFIQRYAEAETKPNEYHNILDLYKEIIDSTTTWLEAQKNTSNLTSQETVRYTEKLLSGQPLAKTEADNVKKTLSPYVISYKNGEFPYNIDRLTPPEDGPTQKSKDTKDKADKLTRFLAMYTALSDNPNSGVALYKHFYDPEARNMYSFSRPRNNVLFSAFQAQLVIDTQNPQKPKTDTIATKILHDALEEPSFWDKIWGTPRFHKNQIAKDIIGHTPFDLVDTLIDNNPDHASKIAKIVLEINKNNKNAEACPTKGFLANELSYLAQQTLGRFDELFRTEAYKLKQDAIAFQKHKLSSGAMAAAAFNKNRPKKSEEDSEEERKEHTKIMEEAETKSKYTGLLNTETLDDPNPSATTNNNSNRILTQSEESNRLHP